MRGNLPVSSHRSVGKPTPRPAAGQALLLSFPLKASFRQ